MGKVGMKDIAARANVSIATVSHVLNGTQNVRFETKERVLKAIEEMNYKTNTIARSLKSKKTNTIGVIAEDVTVFNVPEIIDGIHDYADRHDLHIVLTNLRLHKRVGHDYSNIEKFRKQAGDALADLAAMQVDGIVYIGIHPRDVTGLIDPLDVPIVYAYCYTQNDPSIQYNDEEATYDAIRYLRERGHSRIAVIAGLMDSIPSRLRFNGYIKALTEFELPFEPHWIKVGDWGLESGQKLTRELLDLPDRPTAVLVMNDVMAAGALRAAQESGVSVPEQLAVIGFDNREFGAYLNPRLTTMGPPLHEIGLAAMRTLARLINGEEHKPEVTPRCLLVERGSVSVQALKSL